jgi:hypothetical protein
MSSPHSLAVNKEVLQTYGFHFPYSNQNASIENKYRLSGQNTLLDDEDIYTSFKNILRGHRFGPSRLQGGFKNTQRHENDRINAAPIISENRSDENTADRYARKIDLSVFLTGFFGGGGILLVIKEIFKKLIDPDNLIKALKLLDFFKKWLKKPSKLSVEKQLAGLANSENTELKQSGLLFEKFRNSPLPYVKEYIVSHLIVSWNKYTTDKVESQKNAAGRHDDQIPREFIESFAKEYLKNENIDTIYEKTAKWLAESINENTLNIREVAKQIAADVRFSCGTDPRLLKFLAQYALKQWIGIKAEDKAKYIDIWSYCDKSKLPDKFIDSLEKIYPSALREYFEQHVFERSLYTIFLHIGNPSFRRFMGLLLWPYVIMQLKKDIRLLNELEQAGKAKELQNLLEDANKPIKSVPTQVMRFKTLSTPLMEKTTTVTWEPIFRLSTFLHKAGRTLASVFYMFRLAKRSTSSGRLDLNQNKLITRIAQNISKLTPEHVQAQLEEYDYFARLKTKKTHLLKYLAEKLIDEWSAADPQIHTNAVISDYIKDLFFVSQQKDGKIASAKAGKIAGKVPPRFITYFVRSEMADHYIKYFESSYYDEAKQVIPIHMQLIASIAELGTWNFESIRNAAFRILKTWNKTPEEVKKLFGVKHASGHLPDAFINIFRPWLISKHKGPRRILQPEPLGSSWKTNWMLARPRFAGFDEYIEGEQKPFGGAFYGEFGPFPRQTPHDYLELYLKGQLEGEFRPLSSIKELSFKRFQKDGKSETGEIYRLEDFLFGRQKQELIDDWNELPQNLKDAFIKENQTNRFANADLNSIPLSYLEFWVLANFGVSVCFNMQAVSDDNEPGNSKYRCGGSGAAGGGISQAPFCRTPPASIISGGMTAYPLTRLPQIGPLFMTAHQMTSMWHFSPVLH